LTPCDSPYIFPGLSEFGFIVLFGLVSLSEGVWRICYRESNKYILYVLSGMGAIFIAARMLARRLK
jgi:hypothetical protein